MGSWLDRGGWPEPQTAIVAVGAAHDPHPLDLAGGEGLDGLLLLSDKPNGADAAAIREGDVLAVRFELQPVCLYSTERLSCWKRG